MKRRAILCLAALSLPAISACTAEEIRVSTITREVCKKFVPHADYDPDGVLFEQWAGSRDLAYGGDGTWSDLSTGKRIGFALAEDSDIWNSRRCASTAQSIKKVDLTQGRVPSDGWPAADVPTPELVHPFFPSEEAVLDPCDPAIDALPTTEDQSFVGWRPPACFESDVQPASGPAPVIGSPGHGA